MAASISRALRSMDRNFNATSRGLPLLNEITSTLNGYLSATNHLQRKKFLMRWYKSIPELTALANKVARDITASFHFEPVSGTSNNRVKKANQFAIENNYRRQKFSRIVDRLITGEDFLWIGGLDKEKVNDAAKEFVKNKYAGLETKEIDDLANTLTNQIMLENKLTSNISNTNFSDEDLFTPRKMRHVASSSMKIEFDDYDVIQYVQEVGSRREYFKPNEIIRGTFSDIDGKVQGFTPVEAIVVQLELLRFMWQNMLAIHKNGGAPDKLFVLKNVDVNSPSYKRIREQLENYKLVENKHGNMLFTGDVDVQDLAQLENMQFMDMGLLITGLIAMQWQIPRSSIPYIVGGTNTRDDTGGNSERGYWDNITYAQNMDADLENSQLWIPKFGVRLVYDKVYIQKDIQEQTARQLVFNNVQLMEEILSRSNKKLKTDKRIQLLGIDSEDVEEMTEEDKLRQTQFSSTLNNQTARPTGKDPSSDDMNRNQRKREEQQGSNASAGKPTGYGKEKDWREEQLERLKELSYLE